MRQKKIWIPLIVLIGLTGGFIFYQHHSAELEPIKIYLPTPVDTADTPKTSLPPKTETETVTEPGEISQTRQLPKTVTVIEAVTEPGEISQGGHFHEDGTFHAEPHATPRRIYSAESLMDHPPLDPPILTQKEIQELDTLLKTELLSQETYDKLSEKQKAYLNKVVLPGKYLTPEDRRQATIDFYAQWGLNPPPEGWRYSFKEIGVLNLDENGNAIIARKGDGSIKKSYGGHLLNASK